MEKILYSHATLSQRLAALFVGNAWQCLDTESDLCLVEGHIADRKVLVVATDPAAALGTFGIAECKDLRWALLRARATGVPLLLLIDSAGARLNAGLPVQGALRALMREMLDARLTELPMLAVLGRYAFGAASMLAFAAHERLYSESTLLAMSGPRVLQAALQDKTASSTVLSKINGISRTTVSKADKLITDDLVAYAHAICEWVANPVAGSVTRDTLVQERQHLLQRLPNGAAHAIDKPVLVGDTLRFLADRPFGAADAVALSELAESAYSSADTKSLTIEIDCHGHSILLQDEEIILSQYLAYLALCLRYLVREGSPIRLLVKGNLSGGIYIALAAAASTTALTPGAVIRTLPHSSLVHIFGSDTQETPESASYVEWGVVDTVLQSNHQNLTDSKSFATV